MKVQGFLGFESQGLWWAEDYAGALGFAALRPCCVRVQGVGLRLGVPSNPGPGIQQKGGKKAGSSV